MTELYQTLKDTASVVERSKLEAMRIKAEQYKMSYDQQQSDGAGAQEQAYYGDEGRQAQGVAHKYSPSPSVYAYSKAKACKAARLPNSSVLVAKAINGAVPAEGAAAQRPAAFRPDRDYIYVPPKQQLHYVSMQKAQLGQTTLVHSVDQGAETLYRDHFLETQAQNDYSTPANARPCRAGDGLQPLQAAYVVDDGVLRFAKSQTNRLVAAENAGGLLIKDINREAEPVDPKERYIETFKRAHPEAAGAPRPYAGGTVPVRRIREEDWKEIPAGVKQLKMDMRTTMRTEHPVQSQHAYEISARDRAKCRAAFLRDHNGENPVGGGVYHKPITTNQYFSEVLVQHDQERRAEAEARLRDGAVEAARRLYGCTTDEARNFVATLNEGERQAVGYLHREAERRTREWE